MSAGLRCLDVGCGGGDVIFDLASPVGITGFVVGVDVDATRIARDPGSFVGSPRIIQVSGERP